MLMPHESTVAPHDKSLLPSHTITPTTAGASPIKTLATPIATPVKPRLTKRADSQVPNLFANPPAAETQTHELDDDADDEEPVSSSSN